MLFFSQPTLAKHQPYVFFRANPSGPSAEDVQASSQCQKCFVQSTPAKCPADDVDLLFLISCSWTPGLPVESLRVQVYTILHIIAHLDSTAYLCTLRRVQYLHYEYSSEIIMIYISLEVQYQRVQDCLLHCIVD